MTRSRMCAKMCTQTIKYKPLGGFTYISRPRRALALTAESDFDSVAVAVAACSLGPPAVEAAGTPFAGYALLFSAVGGFAGGCARGKRGHRENERETAPGM